MLKKQENTGQLSFYTTFEELLDHHHPFYILSNQINWKLFEETFRKHYTENFGRPAIPIRRMVALLMLKHIRNLSDESVVEQWSENSYYQYFSGEKLFNRGAPCEASELAMFTRVLAQKRKDSNKIYSLHEPEVRCIAKGKEHKKYEFGSKVSITITQGTNVIIGALNIPGNDYDGHTLEAVLNQQERLTGHQLKEVYVDRGYKGVKLINETLIHSPKAFSSKLRRYKRSKLKKGFTNRAAIEPRIGHLKTDHRLSKNFYKGIQGDTINVMLAAATMNFKRMINIWKVNPIFCLFRFLSRIIFQNSPTKYIFHDKAFT